jgi:hypothetical protein
MIPAPAVENAAPGRTSILCIVLAMVMMFGILVTIAGRQAFSKAGNSAGTNLAPTAAQIVV